MVPGLRSDYNHFFTEEKYQAYINDLESLYPGQLDFRVAETPVFVPRDFTEKILAACEGIIDVVSQPGYLKQSRAAIPKGLEVPGENGFPHCIAFDFGVCRGKDGLEPQLIEMQGFPSLFAWEVVLPEVHARHFPHPPGYSVYLGGLDRNSYVEKMKRLIIGDEDPEQVVLLEIFPEQQKTRVDFHATVQLLGLKILCLTRLEQEGRKLFYRNQGKRVEIRRIYNRVIFDDLFQQPAEVQEKGKIFHQDLDVTWVPHPNWFYRLSKYSLPFIRHPYVPHTEFLHQASLPENLGDYVVKPLFSFAGQGVIIDVTKRDIDDIKDPQNWIIQKKVEYAPAIPTPDGPAKVEIRIFYFQEEGEARPVPVNNLARLSKGKMIGVRYNKDKTWVGGSFCLFEKQG